MDGSELQVATVQIFFHETAKNHPVLTSTQAAVMLNQGVTSADMPNWFYYWYQTPANFGLPRLGNGDCGQGRPGIFGSSWYVIAGQDLNTNYYLGPTVRDMNGTTVLPWIQWNVNGIDKFAVCVRHEACHVADFNIWWPNGYVAGEDQDCEMIPDALEATGFTYDDNEEHCVSYNPNLPDSNGDYHSDSQDLCLRKQMTPSSIFYWIAGSADNEDWSDNGHQHSI